MNAFDCTDILALLSGIVDGELKEPERHGVERHLAGCAACRDLVDRAESLDALVVSDAVLTAGSEPFGAASRSTVLAQTSRARGVHRAGLVGWSGWLVAAAVLGAAVILPTLRPSGTTSQDGVIAPSADRGTFAGGTGTSRITGSGVSGAPGPTGASSASWKRSWTWDGDSSAATEREAEAFRHSSLRTDLESLHAAAALIELLFDGDPEGREFQDFAMIQRAREISLYDDLAARLARVRLLLEPTDASMVIAMEGLLFRLVGGPLEREDLDEIAQIVQSLDLAARLRRIADAQLARRTI
ncbi:MAG: zf-HC2 domain-containing protein [Phycisphaeraceae bacterium]|nr:zf-HC2 domain-containing protein [Phycisphaeraceae bacterium]